MAKTSLKSAGTDKNELVSFRLDRKLYSQLEEYAKKQTAEEGLEMSASQAARKLMLDALRRLQSKKP